MGNGLITNLGYGHSGLDLCHGLGVLLHGHVQLRLHKEAGAQWERQLGNMHSR